MGTPECKEWDSLVIKEHDSFVKYKVWKPVPEDEVPEDAKVLTSMWAMKPKPNGIKRARLNARGFDQQEGLHYLAKFLSAPVVCDITIRIVMVLIIMASWATALLDIK
eukprot:12182554-Ditylum_brightwellii.AAC.1